MEASLKIYNRNSYLLTRIFTCNALAMTTGNIDL